MIDTELLLKLHQPTPRYTSYPTAPEWSPLLPGIYAERLQELSRTQSPISLYIHIPFCQSMCLFCGCSVVLNRRPENEEVYVDYLLKELDLITRYLGKGRKIVQLHFGGGTPTKLSEPLFKRLFEAICTLFSIDFSQEVAIEVDPRTVCADEGKKLRFLKELGFNRMSFGVQDTDPKVQAAVKRNQTLEMTQYTYHLAKSLGFSGINLDLIYGLPFQTITSFQKTIQDILEMRPDRIALFSYAKVPWLKAHQKAISDETLPSTKDKFHIYSQARSQLIQQGYVGIGMDHFALASDELAMSYQKKTLQRNFQGYTLRLAEEMLGIGVSSIGYIRQTYVQNFKDLSDYYAALDKEELPIHRGKVLSLDDLLRKWVIHTLMCNFELNKRTFEMKFGAQFDAYFADRLSKLASLEKDGLIVNTAEKIEVTPLGELFIRNIAVTFDAYLNDHSSHPKFSQSI